MIILPSPGMGDPGQLLQYQDLRIIIFESHVCSIIWLGEMTHLLLLGYLAPFEQLTLIQAAPVPTLLLFLRLGERRVLYHEEVI